MLSVVRIVKATRGWYEAGADKAPVAAEARQ
jgi:ACR3 family arsenite transporter